MKICDIADGKTPEWERRNRNKPIWENLNLCRQQNRLQTVVWRICESEIETRTFTCHSYFRAPSKTSNVIFESDEIKLSCFALKWTRSVWKVEQSSPEMKIFDALMDQFKLDLLFIYEVELSKVRRGCCSFRRSLYTRDSATNGWNSSFRRFFWRMSFSVISSWNWKRESLTLKETEEILHRSALFPIEWVWKLEWKTFTPSLDFKIVSGIKHHVNFQINY